MNLIQPSLEFIIDLAKEAGVILKEGYGKQHQVRHKGRTDLVTEIDHQSEDLLVNRIRSEFPNHMIVTEESGLLEGDQGQRWYIDPLDGTLNYAKGMPIFCVSIAYARGNQMQLAAAYDPMMDECYYAAHGQGAWLNGDRIHVSDTSELIDAMLVTGFPNDLDQVNNNLDYFMRVIYESQTLRRLGSAVLDQVYVAAGRLDGYWEVGVNPWDIAAGTMIIEEAGGLITTMQGDADYMKPPFDIIAANPLLHPKLFDALHAGAHDRQNPTSVLSPGG
jgi:myo-inositol-1(or 4)-monophosphatase